MTLESLIPSLPALLSHIVVPTLTTGLGVTLLFYLIAPRIGHRIRSFRERKSVRRGEALSLNRQLLLLPCAMLGWLLGPLVPGFFRQWLQQLVRSAGLDQALDTAEVIGGQVWLGLAALLGSLMLNRLGFLPVTLVVFLTLVGLWWPWSLLADAAARRRAAVRRDLPMFLDLITLAVGGGMTTAAAMALAVERGPRGPLASELARTLREISAGRRRHDALRHLADRLHQTGLDHAVGAIISAERQGADLTQVLQAQASQRRQERFLHAEQRAMKAPVKMLLPLVLFIFPGTFLILMYPVALQLMQSGLL